MILSYKGEFCRKYGFIYKIKNGVKIHTLRKDPSDRWQPGKKIHHWKDSPRNPSKYPYQFDIGICENTQMVKLHKNQLIIDWHILFEEQEYLDWFAQNDGLSDYPTLFSELGEGTFKIIHFTDFQYERIEDAEDIPF